MTQERMTPSQFIINRIGGDAETICALLSDIEQLKARIVELEGDLAAVPPQNRKPRNKGGATVA